MKRTLTNRSTTGAQAKVIRDIFRDAANARRSANASGGQEGNSELDKLRAINAELIDVILRTPVKARVLAERNAKRKAR